MLEIQLINLIDCANFYYSLLLILLFGILCSLTLH